MEANSTAISTTLLIDNQAISLVTDPTFHACTKYIGAHYPSVRPEEATHDFSFIILISCIYIHFLVIEIVHEGALVYYLPSHMYMPTPA
jgi:hypothetical protein